jgi:hypothetical protein
VANNLVGVLYPTLIDVAKEYDAVGRKLPFVAALSQANAITRVMPFEMGNQPRGHMVSVETYSSLPSTRAMNQGITPTFGKSMQIVEQMSEMADVFEVDSSVAESMGDPNVYRLRQVQARIRAMGRKFAYLVFYGNQASVPTDFNGLAMRYNSLSTSTAKNAINVIDCGGTTGSGQTSIWFLGFGPMALTGIHPSYGVAGFQHKDWGLQILPNATDSTGGSNGRLEIYRDTFKWQGGIALVDWRHCQRLCNVDVADIKSASPATDLTFFMDRAIARIPFATNEPPEAGVIQTNPAYWWVLNRTVREALGHQLKKVVIAGAGIRTDNVRESQVYMHEYEYSGYPIGIVDQLVNTEAVVS